MSARDVWRWLVFSVTGRVPGEERRAAKEYTRALGTPPGEEATAYMREALARRRVVDSREAAALFYEDDEDPAAVQAAFDRGEGGVTAAPHRYLSTGCLHGEHGYCQSNTGSNGTKTPASCKFCGAECECDCHTSTDLEEGVPELKDAASALNCPHAGDTWFDRSVCAEPCGSMHDRCIDCGAVTGRHECPIEAGRDQPTCDASASAGVLGRRMTFGPCVLRKGHQGPVHEAADGSSWEPLDDTAPVPRDALRRLVKVARWVSGDPREAAVRATCADTDDCCSRDTCRLDTYRAAHPSPRPYAKAGRALAALDDAGLLDQFREED